MCVAGRCGLSSEDGQEWLHDHSRREAVIGYESSEAVDKVNCSPCSDSEVPVKCSEVLLRPTASMLGAWKRRRRRCPDPRLGRRVDELRFNGGWPRG